MAEPAPKTLTPARLEKAAFDYLARFAASEAGLRRSLIRRVDKAFGRDAGRGRADADSGSPAAAARAAALDAIPAILAKCRRLGLIDDRRFAEGRVASLRRAGRSRRQIQAALAAKGVERETAAAALGAAEDEDGRGAGRSEWQAAIALARRRRLGPFAKTPTAESRRKSLAALARAGFDYAIAARVAAASTAEALLGDSATADED